MPLNAFGAKHMGDALQRIPKMGIGILGGTLLSAALSALFNIGSTISANKYNSPRAQLKRLRQAGLPLSYMYKGNVATQSEIPKLSIDPTLGTLAKKQGMRLDADTQEQLNETQAKDMMSGILHTDPKTGITTESSNRMEMKRAETFIKNYEQELKSIELQVEREAFAKGIPIKLREQALEKASQQIKNLLAQAGLMDQLKKIRGFDELLNESLTKDLNSMPEWISSLLKIILIATKRK